MGAYEGQEDLQLHEVWALVRRRDAELFSTRQTLRAKGKSRTSRGRNAQVQVEETTEADPPDTTEANKQRRVQNWSKHLEGLLEGRTGIVAAIVDRLVLKRSVGERAELRTMGGMLQERYLAVSLPLPACPASSATHPADAPCSPVPQIRDAVKMLEKKVYTAVNSLEMRLNEQISTRAFARIRKVLTQVKNAKGEWERFQLATPPKPRRPPRTSPWGYGRAEQRHRQ